jgi:Protein of unknown function (DUF2950)
MRESTGQWRTPIAHRRMSHWAGSVIAGLLILLAQGCASSPKPATPGVFASPQDAVQSLTDSLREHNTAQLLAVMGPGSEQIVASGDQVADRQRRERFLALYDQKHAIVNETPDEATLVVGDSQWPFPVPIVQRDGGWVFDVEAGKQEILNRRIGENELAAIQVCKAVADAQREYALRDVDGSDVPQYAQHFASDPGKRNGLYWLTMTDEEPSPLGVFAARAAAEGYARTGTGTAPTAYHGYCYRMLRGQGPHAPGGELDYVVDGKMTLGYAVVAYPAEYGNSGIMTFIMGSDGVVYQKDLGANTRELATEIKAYDPDPSWTKAR